MRLSGKRALLLGAATNIGRACALDFAANGADIMVADINEAGAVDTADLARKSGVKAYARPFDITDEDSVRETVAAAEKELNGLDTLVIFAGMMRTGKIDTFDAETWDAIFRVNARGTFLAAKYGAPALRRAGGGSLITTASLAGLRGAPGMTAYAASKGAVIAFTTALAQELAPSNIRVNSVLPGWIDTPFNGPAIEYMGGTERHADIVRGLIPLGRQGVASEVSPLYVFLASEEARYITAKAMQVDGGMAH